MSNTNGKRDIPDIKLEGARIVFRNFSGKPDKFNPQGGKRGFGLILPDKKFADALVKDGWNVKELQSKDDTEDPTPFLPVKVNYGAISPTIYMVTKRNKTLLNEDTISLLDQADIENIDIIVRPYQYDVRGEQGVAAYVKTMYVVIREDEFASKYNGFDSPIDEPDELPFG